MNKLLALIPMEPHRNSIMQAANDLDGIWNGLTKLGQCDAASIFTTIAETLLPRELQIKWADHTVSRRKVPPIQELVKFLKERATQPQYEKKYTLTPQKKQVSKPKSVGHQGSIHVTSTQPSQQSTPQSVPAATVQSSKGNQGAKAKPTSYPPCKYECPLCKENHYAYSCKVFRGRSVDKRQEFASSQSLCLKCLKPGHTAEDCRSRHSCHVCEGNHNSLLHGATLGSNRPAASINVIKTSPTANSLQRNKLMMTCKAKVSGKTGKTLTARCFLDPGADVSAVTSQVAKELELISSPTPITVAGFGAAEPQVCYAVDLTITSIKDPSLSLEMTALVTDKITDVQPRVNAAAVRRIVEERGLNLADPSFDTPGQIDVLLGADVLPFIYKSKEP